MTYRDGGSDKNLAADSDYPFYLGSCFFGGFGCMTAHEAWIAYFLSCRIPCCNRRVL